jgi:hypothetical protein
MTGWLLALSRSGTQIKIAPLSDLQELISLTQIDPQIIRRSNAITAGQCEMRSMSWVVAQVQAAALVATFLVIERGLAAVPVPAVAMDLGQAQAAVQAPGTAMDLAPAQGLAVVPVTVTVLARVRAGDLVPGMAMVLARAQEAVLAPGMATAQDRAADLRVAQVPEAVRLREVGPRAEIVAMVG